MIIAEIIVFSCKQIHCDGLVYWSIRTFYLNIHCASLGEIHQQVLRMALDSGSENETHRLIAQFHGLRCPT